MYPLPEPLTQLEKYSTDLKDCGETYGYQKCYSYNLEERKCNSTLCSYTHFPLQKIWIKHKIIQILYHETRIQNIFYMDCSVYPLQKNDSLLAFHRLQFKIQDRRK